MGRQGEESRCHGWHEDCEVEVAVGVSEGGEGGEEVKGVMDVGFSFFLSHVHVHVVCLCLSVPVHSSTSSQVDRFFLSSARVKKKKGVWNV